MSLKSILLVTNHYPILIIVSNMQAVPGIIVETLQPQSKLMKSLHLFEDESKK
jgi:hypothetical protein